MLTKQTNIKFVSTKDVPMKYSRFQRWKDVNDTDIFLFLAVSLLIPRVKKLKLKEYWSHAELLQTPIFREIMSLDQYF